MSQKPTEEEENKYIKGETAEGLIIIYQASDTDPKLKQKIQDELFDRLTRLVARSRKGSIKVCPKAK